MESQARGLLKQQGLPKTQMRLHLKTWEVSNREVITKTTHRFTLLVEDMQVFEDTWN